MTLALQVGYPAHAELANRHSIRITVDFEYLLARVGHVEEQAAALGQVFANAQQADHHIVVCEQVHQAVQRNAHRTIAEGQREGAHVALVEGAALGYLFFH